MLLENRFGQEKTLVAMDASRPIQASLGLVKAVAKPLFSLMEIEHAPKPASEKIRIRQL